MKILVVEDHQRLGRFLRQGLMENHYTVEWATSCAAARDLLAEMHFDLVVLDIGLPDGDGLALLKQWREFKFNEPVIILSARDSLEDKIAGLDFGADDYLPKPFSLEELLAHIRALLRRQSTVKLSVLEHNGIRLDLFSHTVHCNGRQVDLTGREYALLEVFMQSPGRVLTRTYIVEKIWPSNYDIDANLLDVYMSRLRNKLENDQHRNLFKTVRGVGYQFV
jgi:DNA-binding response OmpR family regulator